MNPVRLVLETQEFQPLEALQQWHQSLLEVGDMAAAEAMFIGRVRSVTSGGDTVRALELEHYPGMTERQIHQLGEELLLAHGARRALVHHRVGLVQPDEPIVLLAVQADRRGMAQRCCQGLLGALKHDAPFWKREWRGDQGFWLDGNTPL